MGPRGFSYQIGDRNGRNNVYSKSGTFVIGFVAKTVVKLNGLPICFDSKSNYDIELLVCTPKIVE